MSVFENIKHITLKAVAALLLCCAAFALCCCDKNDAAPDCDGDGTMPACTHAPLVHHPEIAATYDECGMAEYWQCPLCGEAFSDSKALNPFDGRFYSLPLRIVDVPWNPSSPQVLTKNWGDTAVLVGLAAEAASLIAACTAFVVSIVSLTKTTDSIASDMEELASKTEKSAEDLENMNKLAAELTTTVNSLNTKISDLTPKVNELNGRISELLVMMSSTETLEDSVLSAISDLEKDTFQGRVIDDRYNNIIDLKYASVGALFAIGSYIKEYSDTTHTTPDVNLLVAYKECKGLSDNVLSVISSWGRENACYPAMTLELLESFLNVSITSETPFSEFLDDYYEDHFAWDHQRHNMRNLALVQDRLAVLMSRDLAGIYFQSCAGIDSSYAASLAKTIAEKYEQVDSIVSGCDAELSKELSDGPWHCGVTGRYFKKEVLTLDLSSFLSGSSVTVVNDTVTAFSKSLAGLYKVEQSAAMTLVDWEMIQQDFNSWYDVSASSVWELLFSTTFGSNDRSGMVFSGDQGENAKYAVVLPYSSVFIVKDNKLYLECCTDDSTNERIHVGNVSGGAVTPVSSGYSFITLDTYM